MIIGLFAAMMSNSNLFFTDGYPIASFRLSR